MSQAQVLIAPVVALMGLAFLLSATMRNFHATKYEPLAFGVLFGSTVILGMTNPLTLGEGLIFDTRTLLVGTAVAFFGPLAGAITMGMGIICRIIIGGVGTLSGIIGLVLAFALAMFWLRFARNRIKKPIIKDALLGVMITPSIVAIFVLPFDTAIAIIQSILPTLLACNILGTIAIGFVFRREKQYFAEARTLQDHARRDGLTDLLNRRGMDRAVDAAKLDPERGHAVYYFDIDNFKHINDTYGHDAGDAALAIVAARIKDIIRGEAVFARHGGDEFSIYMPSLDAGDVQAVADRLCRTISNEKFSHGEQVFPVSISIGGYWSKEQLPLQDMLNHADTQLLLAKRAGKSRAQIGFDHRDDVSSGVA